VALIVALGALVLFPSWPFRDLWTPDEPRYMEVAREMALTGDYLVPHLNGEVYPDKPPLFFWLAAGLYKLGFGYNSGRLVAALAAIGTLLLVYALARRWMPRSGPLLSCLVAMTLVLFSEAKAGVLDPLIMFFVAASIFSGHRALQPDTRRRPLWWLGFYGCAACGVLTKGPVGLFLPGLVVLGYGPVSRRRIRAGGWAHAGGVIVFLALVLGWLLPAVTAGGEAYRNEMLFSQTLSRVVRSDSHRKPVYFFIARFPMDFFPWSLLFPLAFLKAVFAWKRGREDKGRLIVLWFGVLFVLHSLISCKRQGYLMPLIPAVALALGDYLVRGLEDSFPWPKWHRVLLRILFVLCGLAGVAMAAVWFFVPALIARSPKLAHAQAQAASILTPGALALGVLIGLAMLSLSAYGFYAVARYRTRAIGVLIAAMLIVSLAADVFVSPRVNHIKSARHFCEQATPYLNRADAVHLLRNDMSGVYNLYTGRVAMPVLREPDDVRRALSTDARAAIIADERKWERMTVDLPVDHCRLPVERSVGGRQMVLVINWDPVTGKLPAPTLPGQASTSASK